MTKEDVGVHSISGRCKSLESLEIKGQKKFDKGAPYIALQAVTDLAAVRVITYFTGDVDTVARIIEREFEVDRKNSVDKRVAAEPDRFGYISLHYVVGLRAERLCLSEYEDFAGVKAEIQVRSILQHAWAEIEHDIGYKAKMALPDEIKRRFSRLSGLLELADEEFRRIKTTVSERARDVQASTGEALLGIAIDRASLDSFVASNKIVKNADAAVSKIIGGSIGRPYFLPQELEVFKLFEVNTLGQIESLLRDNLPGIMRRAEDVRRERNDSDMTLPAGISVFYLFQILASKSRDRAFVQRYLKTMGIGLDDFQEYLMNFSAAV
ncbi:GTP pyrophosphokinase family protein [Pseudomonas asiatica]|uniref:GTP pyrophosphokinase n=1 Tax=Pseudomonas asiatica TaxID=2219225 RepID=UPI00383AF732